MTNRKKVLVVDDSPLLVKTLSLGLDNGGFEVFTANSGPEALESLAAGQPDIILLDIGMPGMDGWQTCQVIREHYQIPVILLSGHALSPEVTADLASRGAADYLMKPVRALDLISRIEAVLKRHQAANE